MNSLMPVLPKEELSHWVGRIVHRELPPALRLASMRAFAKGYNLNLEEAELPLEEYRSIGDLFTRKLKPTARPLAEGIVHPCDAVVTQAGRIHEDRLLQVKGVEYSVYDLMGDLDFGQRFFNGGFLTYYLCPTDYHRVHAPWAGTCEWLQHIPGKFWPVNRWSVFHVPSLYAVNERVAMVFQQEDGGSIGIVMVAATNVGNIKIAFEPSVDTSVRYSRRQPHTVLYDRDRGVRPALGKGEEIGLFAMGSSVVMLLDEKMCQSLRVDPLAFEKWRGVAVKMGQAVGG